MVRVPVWFAYLFIGVFGLGGLAHVLASILGDYPRIPAPVSLGRDLFDGIGLCGWAITMFLMARDSK